jgi:hypothetical protein
MPLNAIILKFNVETFPTELSSTVNENHTNKPFEGAKELSLHNIFYVVAKSDCKDRRYIK